MNILVFSPAQWCGLGPREAGEIWRFCGVLSCRVNKWPGRIRKSCCSLRCAACPSARAFGFHEGCNDSVPDGFPWLTSTKFSLTFREAFVTCLGRTQPQCNSAGPFVHAVLLPFLTYLIYQPREHPGVHAGLVLVVTQLNSSVTILLFCLFLPSTVCFESALESRARNYT